jgi:hypothetical protein
MRGREESARFIPFTRQPARVPLRRKHRCGARAGKYRGTSPIRNRPLLGRYSRPMPRASWWSYWGGQFLMREAPLYSCPFAKETSLGITSKKVMRGSEESVWQFVRTPPLNGQGVIFDPPQVLGSYYALR